MAMKLVAAAVLLAATTAYAQAPGETLPEPAAPIVYAAPGIPVMANRWAVGLSAGSLSIAPKDSPDNKTQFGIGQLSLRYRATYHLELELALAGGRQQLQDGTQGDLDVSTALLGFRYRFAAAQHWNWWLGAGIGGISVTQFGATDQQKQDAQRPMGAVSIGIEHRWQQFALQAELHGFAVGERQDQQADAPPKAMPVANTMEPPPDVSVAPSQERSGGTVTIGASYYF
jgi:hypothetical protein